MDRRELIKYITLLTGATVVGADFFLTGCKNTDKSATTGFSEADAAFFDEVAETVIPKTDTPGAKDARVGKFMASYPLDCYDPGQLQVLRNGIGEMNKVSEKKYNSPFVKITDQQKRDLLMELDAEAKKQAEQNEKAGGGSSPHYFTLMKQLVLLGFFTSEQGVTRVLRYDPVPGKYQGCIDYKEGETSWA